MNRALIFFLSAVLALALPAAQAEPAAWFWWASNTSQGRVCAQVSPGPGWDKVAGPYRNARCRP